jgi:GNAT superfamily N-acetyltransferase
MRSGERQGRLRGSVKAAPMPTCRQWDAPPPPVFAELWYAMLEECGLVGSGVHSDWQERLLRHFVNEMEQGLLQWFVAEDAGRIIGTCAAFLGAGRSNILKDVTATLAGVYVLPEYRRRGLARALTELAIGWCRQRGCAAVRLHASPAGRPLYESLGFVTATEMMRLDLR